MEKKSGNKGVSSEVLAAFLDGNATSQESMDVMCALSEDPVLREIVSISQAVDEEIGDMVREIDVLPLTAMAASCGEGAYCSLECEKYVLRLLNVPFDEEQIMSDAVRNGWYKESGTALHNVGRHLESRGLTVVRRYRTTVADMAEALGDNQKVIVAVDGGELIGNREEEMNEDLQIGQIPDHVIVVLSLDLYNRTVKVYDPDSQNAEDVYPLGIFENAWNDSKNYMVTVTQKDMKAYEPKPIDLSDVELAADLNELREAIAENAHDVWAVERQAQGWTYGLRRDDTLKQTPCMVAYSQLPDSEKKFDRDMAMNTLKLVRKLGYDIIRREDTELYQVLMTRLRTSGHEYQCRRCGNAIYKRQVFCDRCGLELNMDWNEK